MAQIKKVILKDTMSGDQLFPATSIDSLYNTDGTKWTPPTIPSPLNADQLQGHEASYFGTATQYTELSSKYDQLFQSVSNGKSLIASAITGKGISTASDATFQQMATNIGNIETGPEMCNVTFQGAWIDIFYGPNIHYEREDFTADRVPWPYTVQVPKYSLFIIRISHDYGIDTALATSQGCTIPQEMSIGRGYWYIIQVNKNNAVCDIDLA